MKKLLLALTISISLPLLISATAQAPSGKTADTPWPMYQHDPQHTGRSQFLIPLQKPVLLWTKEVPFRSGSGAITFNEDGNLIMNEGGNLIKVDPITRMMHWSFDGGYSSSTPLIASDGNIYYGYGNIFAGFSPFGEMNWGWQLDYNYSFASSATFGLDENLYVVHEGLWSFTPDGTPRWFIPYGSVGAHAPPTIGMDGTIYGGGTYTDLCAYGINGTIEWCMDVEDYSAVDRSAAIGSDGTLYLNTNEGALIAFDTTIKQVKWVFDPPERYESNIGPNRGLAIAPDGSICYLLNSSGLETYLFAVTPDGDLKWKLGFPVNSLTGLRALLRFPITVDRLGNIFLCLENSRCYGISIDGLILWEFEFPLTDSNIVLGGSPPILGADGLVYFWDNHSRLYAYADPAIYPLLTVSKDHFSFKAQPGDNPLPAVISVDSTNSVITYTASITPSVEWLSLPQTILKTPSDLVAQVDPRTLPNGIYHANLHLSPQEQVGNWIDIPFTLNVGMDPTYLPVTMNRYDLTSRVVYLSKWFTERHIAVLEPPSIDRTVLVDLLPNQTYELEISPDGKKAACLENRDGKYQITVFDLDTDQMILEIVDSSSNYQPAWSHDSKQLAFVSTRDDAYGEAYSIRLDGTDLKRLTYNSQNEVVLSWSPTMDELAIGLGNGTIQIVNSDGTNPRMVKQITLQEYLEGWDPSGTKLLMRSVILTDHYVLLLTTLDLQSGKYKVLEEEAIGDATWSPDGSLIAFTQYRDRDHDIFVIKPDGTGLKRVSTHSDREDAQPVWSPNSQWLAFSSRDATSSDDPNWDIFIVRLDGTELTQLTQNIQADQYPFWVP